MLRFSTQSGTEGHLSGGPRCFSRGRRARRRALPLALIAAAASVTGACGPRVSGPEGAQPGGGEVFSRPLDIYRDLGFMTGPAQFPAVAGFATMAGPADSTYVLLAMSLQNSALRFQRDDNGFFAEYRIDVTFMDEDSVSVKRVEGREIVRVTTFAETSRTDESIVYQRAFTIRPGSYIVRLQAADVNSARGFRATDTLTAPDYATDTGIASPILVHEAQGRTTRASMPRLITNPRNTVPYGGTAPLLYVESYGAGGRTVDIRIIDQAGDLVWSASDARLDGADELRHGVIEIPSDALPLGRFRLEVRSSDGLLTARAPIVVTISDQWLVANMEDVRKLLRFIAHPEELDSLQMGSPTQQRAAWDRFWDRRDPLTITVANEFRDAFFQRARYATEAFREPGGRAGWDTDRGEVYIVLGPPDNTVERYVGGYGIDRQPNAQEWVYTALPGGRLNLLFHDRTGFGRFELVPSSASAFRSVAERLKPRPVH